MPELPDVAVYVEHVAARILGRPLVRLELTSPFVLRTVDPPAASLAGRPVTQVRRLGKRIVLGFDGPFAVVHLMIAGRLHWLAPDARLHRRRTLLAFRFEPGLLQLTEAGTKRRASLHLCRDEAGLREHDRGGLELAGSTVADLARVLASERHTLKRSLTDPSLVSGIGNAYSDEILHRARLSPVAMSTALSPDEIARLHAAALEVIDEWVSRLRAQAGDAFPEQVSAFRPEMAVHGKHGQPCPRCGAPVQRIVYADRETNYCAPCQTGGKLLADRALSRLLGKDWPRSLDELEARRAQRG